MQNKTLQMKRASRTALLVLLLNVVGMGKCPAQTQNYDFSAVCPSGQTLYYNIIDATNVEVTYPNLSTIQPWQNYDMPTGDLVLPESVVNNGITYSVTSIGEYVFRRCNGLTSISIPNSVITIGAYAFLDCYGLTYVFIPNSVTHMENFVFCNCKSLSSVTIPISLTSLGINIFYGCSGLEQITVASGNPVYDSRSSCNAIIETNTNTLISGCKNTVIPNSVTSIEDDAFYGCTGLTSVAIGDFVTSIGTNVFGGCSGLEQIIVASGNPKYDSRDNCNAIIESNTNTLISGCKNTVIPNSVISIGEHAFNCNNITSVTIPCSVISIRNHAFYGCSSLTSMSIPNSVTSIGDAAFANCSGLISVVIPNSVISIGASAFQSCTGLLGILYLPNSLTRIEDRVFSYCSGLDELFIPSSIESIGERAFSGCSNLNTVFATGYIPPIIVSGLHSATFDNIPELIVTCGNESRYENSAWNNYFNVIDEDCNSYSINIENCEGGVVHSSVSYAPWGAEVTLTASPMPFYELLSYSVCNANDETQVLPVYDNTFIMPNYDVVVKPHFSLIGFTVNDLIYGINDNGGSVTVIRHVSGSSVTGQLTIPETVTHENVVYSVTNIADNAFCECIGLTSIVIPNSISSIGDYAFYGCHSLTSILIPASVNYLGSKAFGNCSRLTNIYYQVEQDLESGYSPFDNCPNLATIHIDPCVLEIGSEVFRGCLTVHFIVALGETPAILDVGAFEDIKESAIVMVSCGNRINYFSNWNMFAFNNIIEDCGRYGINMGAIGNGGSISTSVMEAQMGEEVQLTVTPNPGMGLASLKVCNASDPSQIIPVSLSGKTTSTYKFTMPPFEVVVMANFTANTSVNENITPSMPANVYPNPTTDFVNVEAENIRYITISNMIGQTIYDGKTSGNAFEYDFSKHEAGIFLIRIETASGVAVKKISVTH